MENNAYAAQVMLIWTEFVLLSVGKMKFWKMENVFALPKQFWSTKYAKNAPSIHHQIKIKPSATVMMASDGTMRPNAAQKLSVLKTHHLEQ